MRNVLSALIALFLAAVPAAGSPAAGSPAAGSPAAGSPAGSGAAEGLGFGDLSRPLSAGLQRPAIPAPRLSLEITAPPADLSLDRLLVPPASPAPSTFQRLLGGAGKGAYGALAVGYMGTLLGAWEDETALALMGAGALLGTAVEGITGSDRVGISVSARPDR